MYVPLAPGFSRTNVPQNTTVGAGALATIAAVATAGDARTTDGAIDGVAAGTADPHTASAVAKSDAAAMRRGILAWNMREAYCRDIRAPAVGSAWLEHATSAMSTLRSNQLS